MKTKYKCMKFDPSKADPEAKVEEIILSQFSEYKEGEKISCSELYMPEEEQENMREWFIKNHKEVKRMPKSKREKEVAKLSLYIFPSLVLHEE